MQIDIRKGVNLETTRGIDPENRPLDENIKEKDEIFPHQEEEIKLEYQLKEKEFEGQLREEIVEEDFIIKDEVLDDEEVFPDEDEIDFFDCLSPFINLLNDWVAKPLGSIAWSVLSSVSRVCSAVQVVVSRIFQKPLFSLQDPAFQEKIKVFKEQAKDLKKVRLPALENKFLQRHFFTQNLAQLHRLNCEMQDAFRQLDFFAKALEKREDSLSTQEKIIQKDIVEVRKSYEELIDQLNDYLLRKGSSIITLYEEILHLFIKKGLEPTEEIRTELIRNGNMLSEVIEPYFDLWRNTEKWDLGKAGYYKLEDIKDVIESLKISVEASDITEPLKLKNSDNNCYMHSVLQALLSVDRICKQFKQPILLNKEKEDENEYQKKLRIQQELLPFIDRKEDPKKNNSQLEYFLFLLSKEPNSQNLKRAIFDSGFHEEFYEDVIHRQLDAASMMEIFIGQFLSNCKFKWKEHATTQDFPGLKWIGREEEMSLLQLPLRNRPENQTLNKLIQFVVHPHYEREPEEKYQRSFNPQEGIVIPGEEETAQISRKLAEKKVGEFVQSFPFTEMPPVLVLHFKRFAFNGKFDIFNNPIMEKNESDVILPENNIVDLSDYYEAPEGAKKQACYKIKSYVVHKSYGESINFGHYVAYVEKNGKYYLCNDMDDNGFEEITKEEFLGQKDAYLVVLERIPDEQENPLL